jgi:hypothetical protein
MSTESIDMQIALGLRLAEMNEEYYRVRAARFSRWSKSVDCTAAAASSAGAVALGTAPMPDSTLGFQVLMFLIGLAVAAGQALQLGDRARRNAELAGKWSIVAGEFRALTTKIKIDAIGIDERRAKLLELSQMLQANHREDTDPPEKVLLGRLQDAIERRHGDPRPESQ